MEKEKKDINTEIVNEKEQVVEAPVETPVEVKAENKNPKKVVWLIAGLIVLVIAVVVVVLLVLGKDEYKSNKDDDKVNKPIVNEVDVLEKYSEFRLTSNQLEAFDLLFLQLENKNKNMVYSPLSIKYALEMLSEGANGKTKEQIENILGTYEANKFTNSKNMSFANAMFIRDVYKDNVKSTYTDNLKQKYNAEVMLDSFAKPDKVNTWIKDKTLGLMGNMYEDISNQDLLLVNALAIDMDWKNVFIVDPGYGHHVSYSHENFYWHGGADIVEMEFEGVKEKTAGLDAMASFNNYDIVKELGEENIRKTVREAFEKHLKENDYNDNIDNYLWNYDITGKTYEQKMELYLDDYVKGIGSNYGREDYITDFELYVDDNVKVFAKDLKEYDGTTLQYVGIMPVKDELSNYIKGVTAKDINALLGNLKTLKKENFKDGVVTKISGTIPKFKMDYELDLMKDLQKLNINDVFVEGKADLTNMVNDKKLFINEAKHKANIEFTQDGIKASAATVFGGAGATGGFDYYFDVPVEEIDITFNKPYIYFIRNKDTNEVWFVGAVYNPLLYSEDNTKVIDE